MLTFEHLITKVKSYLPNEAILRIEQAYLFAKEAHNGQKRYSEEPYIIHPLTTAYYLADFHPDEDTLIAALLHDVSEDTPHTLAEIEAKFGRTVATLVAGMEKLSKVRSRVNEPHIENLQKMFLSMAKDIRVVLIKLCDRLHNIETLQFVPQEKQLRIAQETLQIYAPIASRLGIYRLKTTLEDKAFAFTDPVAYQAIIEQLEETGKFREEYIQETKQILKQILNKEGLQVEVEGRMKGIYSIYRKMKRKTKNSVAEVFDIFAMRIILPDIYKHGKEFIGHLYTALGMIHNHWTPLAHRFKDYIAVPKVNGYRGLHTTVIGLGPKTHTSPTEIQIRSKIMHDQAEFGIASHWLYETTQGFSTLIPASAFIDLEDGEEDTPKTTSILKPHLAWLKGLSKLKEETVSHEEFLEHLKVDIFQDRIFVFTPRGEVKDLPKGATPVDFAYAVHTEIGNHALQAKVNGSIVPLNHELQNGEVVEIITRKNAAPNQNWLAFVKTNYAKSKIRASFRNQNREKNLRVGREKVNEVLAKFDKPPLSPDLGLLKEVDGKKLNKSEREDLLVEVGKGTLLSSTLVRKVYSFEDLIGIQRKALNVKPLAKEEGETKKIILVGGHPNVPLKFPQCCTPKEGDAIRGFVTRGKGVTIHKSDCSVFVKTDPARWQEAYYVSQHGRAYHIPIRVEMRDRTGLLRDICSVIAKMGLNIEDVRGEHEAGGAVEREFLLCVNSYDELERLLTSLEMIPNVLRAYVHHR